MINFWNFSFEKLAHSKFLGFKRTVRVDDNGTLKKEDALTTIKKFVEDTPKKHNIKLIAIVILAHGVEMDGKNW